ncbi:hypothetical protein Ga0609869_003577 [Rhodovulum iodosum]|uniref:O-antigen ligase-related domain-containing protein n=1 Tax=Rhodovulum iodosum TaxID=68291 RepID=A0ABV3XYF8_9RHOB|nr:O-antigen ligase family protein [Rhodovulum robiginosum]RSK38880.1 hypothetical protein EJA01_01650 [Rhodovulum robiginosum]
MPNTFAYIALFAWPLVVAVLFMRLPLPKALVWSLLGGYLLLPEDTVVNLPLLPTWNKALAASLPAAIMCLIVTRRERAVQRATGARKEVAPPRRWGRISATLLVVMLCAPVLTMLTNTEPLIVGPRYLRGLTLYDAGAMVMNTAILLLPFFLARRYLDSREAQIALLQALVFGALAYSLLMLVEIRISPQLHRMLYGFHQHQFIQHIRGGDYRPMVFLQHGLRVGIFIAMCCLAALALFRTARAAPVSAGAGPDRRAHPGGAVRWLLAALWLFVILLISKNFGATLIMLALLPVALLTGPRSQVVVAALLAGTVLVYPALRGGGVIPVQAVEQAIATVDAERAGSFGFRLRQEQSLLEHANRKPVFGWGIWGRSRLYDPRSGTDISTTDGSWILVMGGHGWVGYLARFGLLALPVLMLARRREQARLDPVSAGLALILAANLVDLVPNSSMSPLLWLVAGALLGRCERVRASDPAAGPETAPRGPPAYARRRSGRDRQAAGSRQRT